MTIKDSSPKFRADLSAHGCRNRKVAKDHRVSRKAYLRTRIDPRRPALPIAA